MPTSPLNRVIQHVLADLGPDGGTLTDRELLACFLRSRDDNALAASAKEIAAFVGDNAPDALAKLTASLQAKPRIEPWAGHLPTGETNFRVTAAKKGDEKFDAKLFEQP